MVTKIPEGYHTVTPHLIVSPCAEAIEWYQDVFGADDVSILKAPDGLIMHAELRMGDSRLMLMDPMMGGKDPKELGGTSVTVHLYVEDADALFERAIAAGATPILAMRDEFWGDRYGVFNDPFGQPWSIATKKEDVSAEEIRARAEAMFRAGG